MKRISLLLLILIMVNFPINVSANNEIGLYAEEYQEIMGWGGFPWYARSYQGSQDAPPVNRFGVPEAILRDSGLTIYRIEYLPRFYDSEKDDGTIVEAYIDDVLQTVRKARDLGVTEYMVSIWTPPYAMKSVKTITSGGNSGYIEQSGARYESSLLEDREEDYVQYICDVTNYIKRLNLPLPKYISVQNEPNHVVDYHSAATTPEQYIRLIKKLRKALDRNGLEQIKLIAGEGNILDNNSSLFKRNYQSIHLDDELNDSIDVLATHAYSSNDYWWPISVFARDALKTFDKPIMQAEWCQDDDRSGLSSDNDYAIQAARRFSKDMVEMGYNYWLWWNMWHYNTATTAFINGNQGAAYTENRQYGILSTIWKNAPPGSRVKKLYSTDADINGGVKNNDDLRMELAGFVNQKDNKTVLLITNPTGSAKNSMNFKYIPGTVAEIYQCDASNAFRRLTDTQAITSGQFQLDLPARSVTVVVTDGATLGSGLEQPPGAPALPSPDIDVNRYTVDTVYAEPLSSITVDGDLSDFGDTPYSIGKLISGAVDGTSEFNTRYDNNKLYVGVKVKDSEVRSGDAVRIFIDSKNNKSTSFDSDDFRFSINALTGAITGSGTPANTVLSQCSAAVMVISDGYSVEFAIPWSALGINLYSTDVFGFDIGVNDTEQSGNVLWNGSSTSNSNTSLYGKCKLISGANQEIGSSSLFDDAYASGVTTNTSNVSLGVISSSPSPQGGENISVQATNNSAAYVKLSFPTIPLAVPKMSRADMAVEFWIKSNDMFNLRLGLGSGAGAGVLSSYVMLRSSTGGGDWRKVTVPLSHFNDTGITSTGNYGYINWSDIRELEFRCNNYQNKVFYLDDIKVVPINSRADTVRRLEVIEADDKVSLSWVSPQNAVKNIIYRNEVSIAELDSSVTEYTDEELVSGKHYLYYIVSCDSGGKFSKRSAPILVKTTKFTPPVEPPKELKNLSKQENGGRVIGFSAEQTGAGDNNNPAININDGIFDENNSNPTGINRWAASGTSNWVEIDLGEHKNIRKAILYPVANRAYKYSIEAKKVGGAYKTIVDRSGNSTWASSYEDLLDESVIARYIKLSITGAPSGVTWTAIKELEIYGYDIDAEFSYEVESVTINGDKVQAALNNILGSTDTVQILCAAFDNKNTLIDIDLKEAVIKAEDLVEFDDIDIQANHWAKVFIWNIDTLKPLADAKSSEEGL